LSFGCGTGGGNSTVIPVGASVDTDGDGVVDGKALDTNGDKIADAIEARVHNGLLSLRMPKAAEAKVRKLEIQND
jgi:hypothetical protein